MLVQEPSTAVIEAELIPILPKQSDGSVMTDSAEAALKFLTSDAPRDEIVGRIGRADDNVLAAAQAWAQNEGKAQRCRIFKNEITRRANNATSPGQRATGSVEAPVPAAGCAYEVIDLPIKDITVGNRYRKENGDLTDLAKSMDEVGLLQPIGVTKDRRIVFGYRRLLAARKLGWETIAARVIDLEHFVVGQHDENEVRKEFTDSERVAIADAVAKAMPERRGKVNQDNCPELKGHQTRDIAAKKAGFENGKQYERTKEVVQHGIPELVEAMDQGAISTSAAVEVARKPEEDQKKIVAGGKDSIKAAAKEARETRAKVGRPAKPKSPAEHDWILMAGPELKSVPEYAVQFAFQVKPTDEQIDALVRLAGELGATMLGSFNLARDCKPPATEKPSGKRQTAKVSDAA